MNEFYHAGQLSQLSLFSDKDYIEISQLSLFDSPPTATPFVPSKVCTHCSTKKPLDQFHKDRKRRDGHNPWCKKCTKEHTDAYYNRYPERKQKKYQGYTDRNRARIYDRNKKNRKKHPEYNRKYRKTHLKQRREKLREWRAANPLQAAEAVMRRSARKQNASIGTVSYNRILGRDGMFCYICEQPIQDRRALHFDHVIPLSRGGAHSEENIKPTHAECNLRKHNKLLSEMTDIQRRGV